MKKGLSILISLLTLFASFILFSFPRAQEGTTGLTISPPIFELTSIPGRTLTEKIKVTNTASGKVTVAAEIEDFTPQGEEGQVTITEEEDLPLSMTSWITVTPSTFKLKAGESKLATVKIEVPPTADPGGHYGAVVFVPSAPPGEGQVAVVSKIAALMILKVPGEAKEEARIVSFSAPRFSEYGPITFDLRVENTGNVHIRPLGLIAITDLFGNKVADVQIEQKNILPEATRHIQATWDQRILAGRYTASLLAYYGDTNQILTAAATFTVFPWKATLAGLAGLAILGFLIYRGRERFKLALLILLGRHRA